MKRYSQTLFVILLVLITLAPAQAMFRFDGATATCQVFAEQDEDKSTDKGNGKDGKKQGEEEEPDCE